jgi:hypothetical protein
LFVLFSSFVVVVVVAFVVVAFAVVGVVLMFCGGLV